MLESIIKHLRRLPDDLAWAESSRFNKSLQQKWWDHARPVERDRLRHVYSRLFAIQQHVKEEVRVAEMIEILESYDHNSWPDYYQLKGVTEKLQVTVTDCFEEQAIDRLQRSNYFVLAKGGRGRHNDVAYGLSGKLTWGHREKVLDALMKMGRREYHDPIPSSHENEDGVLHVAVSYKHSARFNQGGTLTWTQANAIWTAIRDIPFMTDDTEVRVWLDQNLHRKNFPPGTEWHEYGLLPYACLQTVYVGTGDYSVKHAYTRPWLWVEMLTGLKTLGIRTKRGHDVLADCDNVLIKRDRYDARKERFRFTEIGCVFGVATNVDQVMGEITRTISLWRRNHFLGHASYEYADDFEKFVNWSRRFVIRGKKYSEMSWNHDNVDVRGMDTIVLIRELPSGPWKSELDGGVVLPNISWERSRSQQTWTVDDLIDRSAVGEIPLSTITETNESSKDGCEEVIIEHRELDYGGIQLRRKGSRVMLVLEKKGIFNTRKPTEYSKIMNKIRDLSSRGSPFVTLTIPKSYGPLLTYQTFTQRFGVANGYARIAMQDEELRPIQVDPHIWQQLSLRVLGVAYNIGICEQVYVMEIGSDQYPVSALEVYMIMNACNGNVDRFKTILKTLKDNCTYKAVGFKDLSDSDKVRLTRGWPFQSLEVLNNKRISSGEMKLDIEEELIEVLREKYDGHAIIWIDTFDNHRVQFTFRRKHFIVRCLSPRMYADRDLAIVEGEEWGEFVNGACTGPLQMVAGVQPMCKVRRFGSGLNPSLRTFFEYDGWELNIFMVPGLFAKCVRCDRLLCPINGLTADVTISNGLYDIRWQQPHDCFEPEYIPFEVDKRNRQICQDSKLPSQLSSKLENASTLDSTEMSNLPGKIA